MRSSLTLASKFPLLELGLAPCLLLSILPLVAGLVGGLALDPGLVPPLVPGLEKTPSSSSLSSVSTSFANLLHTSFTILSLSS